MEQETIAQVRKKYEEVILEMDRATEQGYQEAYNMIQEQKKICEDRIKNIKNEIKANKQVFSANIITYFMTGVTDKSTGYKTSISKTMYILAKDMEEAVRKAKENLPVSEERNGQKLDWQLTSITRVASPEVIIAL